MLLYTATCAHQLPVRPKRHLETRNLIQTNDKLNARKVSRNHRYAATNTQLQEIY